LAGWVRSSSIRSGLAQRARIVLLAADGVSNTDIAQRVGVARQTVIDWRARYAMSGLAGLGGRAAFRPADHLKTSSSTVAKAWREVGVAPWRVETFKFSTDPQLVAKVTDVVGLYLAPPEDAIVLCIDEKSQIQALDRTAPMLPMQPGLAQRRTHDYVRRGTSTLFAALEIATGKVTARCQPRHRHQEFLRFLKQVAAAYPDGELHLVMDNYAATSASRSATGSRPTHACRCTSPRPRHPG